MLWLLSTTVVTELTQMRVDRDVSNVQEEAKYIVFDGDVDAVWVENMNSCMDDNKLLTLPNGERIRLQPYCRMVFEVSPSRKVKQVKHVPSSLSLLSHSSGNGAHKTLICASALSLNLVCVYPPQMTCKNVTL